MLKVVSSAGAAVNLSSPGPIGNVTPNTITGTTVTANTEIDLPAVVNTGVTTGRLYMTDGGDGYDYLNIDTWDGSASYKVNFPGGLTASGTLSATAFQSSTYNIYDPVGTSSVTLAATANTSAYTFKLPSSAGSNNQVLKTDGTGITSWTTQGVQGTAPVTTTAATYTVAATDQWIIGNRGGTITLTLPTASTNTGRSLTIKTITANAIVSASSNVVPLAGGAASTAIVSATAGKFATLVSDGTNWIIMQAG